MVRAKKRGLDTHIDRGAIADHDNVPVAFSADLEVSMFCEALRDRGWYHDRFAARHDRAPLPPPYADDCLGAGAASDRIRALEVRASPRLPHQADA
jgi:hypothetical protein